jgi:EpsI family protein
MGVLLLIAAALVRIGGRRARLRDVLILDFGPPLTRSAGDSRRALPAPFLTATALATLAAVLSFVIPQRVEVLPPRAQFADFPAHLGSREATFSRLADVYSDQLKVDDYLLADYRGAVGLPINVWVAYYASQREGQSTHSPKSCLPGGGWEFRTFEERRLQTPAGELRVNRAVIQNGRDRELMYYWFQQRGRMVTDEYLVKWFIFRDAIERNRTDGALVRVLAPLPTGVTEVAADRELTQFAGTLRRELGRYLPD